ncbi:hypothetical protein NYG85_06530, partial [Campylobacter sp. PS10]|nr:hypothetical protein [Campylobacter gastrosuis]
MSKISILNITTNTAFEDIGKIKSGINIDNLPVNQPNFSYQKERLLKAAHDALSTNLTQYTKATNPNVVPGVINLPEWANSGSEHLSHEERAKMSLQFENTAFGFIAGYFKGGVSGGAPNAISLTEEAYSNTLQTPYGDVKVFFDLYADNDKLGIGELENNKKLFNFD